MTRSRIAALAAAVAASTLACSGGTNAEPPTERTSTSADAPIESATPPATDPLDARPAERMLGIDLTVVRADDGTAVVVSTNEYQTRTTYRLYDPRWRPLTPALELRGHLTIDRGLADSFVGNLFAYREKGRPRVDERVIVSSDGALTTVDDQSDRGGKPVPARPGDRRLASSSLGRLVYRPATRTIHRTTVHGVGRP